MKGSLTRDLPAWSSVPRPAGPTHVPFSIVIRIFKCKFKELAALNARKNLLNFNRLWKNQMTLKTARQSLHIARKATAAEG